MAFLKNLFSDIKNQGTPLAKYQAQVIEYINFLTLQSYGKTALSDDAGFAKASVLLNDLKVISNSLDPNVEFNVYHPDGDLATNVAKSIIACSYLCKQLTDFCFIDYATLRFSFLKMADSNELGVFPIKLTAGRLFNMCIDLLGRQQMSASNDEILVKYLSSISYDNESIPSPYAKKATIFHARDKKFNFNETLFYQRNTDYYDFVISHQSTRYDNYLSVLRFCEEFSYLTKNNSESESHMSVFDLSDIFLDTHRNYLIDEMKVMCKNYSDKEFDVCLTIRLK